MKFSKVKIYFTEKKYLSNAWLWSYGELFLVNSIFSKIMISFDINSLIFINRLLCVIPKTQ